jgi:LysW-gamma-L-lysine carboxypeptidase
METKLYLGMVIVNPKAKDILLLGHMDTVPGELPVDQDDEKITGRGAADAKGPLCAALSALEKHPELWDKVSLIAVPDEEGPSIAARFITDNWDQRPCIILEPSTWQGITISYMGRLFVKCETTCPPSHSGHKKPFAAEELISTWNSLSKKHWVRIRSITGNETKGTMMLDIRFRNEDPAEILKMIPKNIKVELLERTMPYTASKNSILTRTFLTAVREAGGKPVFKNKTGTSDMNVLGAKWKDAPMLAYGPGDGNLGHTNDEYIVLEDYLKGIEVYEKALGCLVSWNDKTLK